MILYGVLMFCLLASVHGDIDDLQDSLSKKLKCGEVATHPVGKVEFNLNNGSIICNWTIKPENATGINMFMQKLVLDDGDNLTISDNNSNESEVVFGISSGHADAFVLITGLTELVVELRTSPKQVQRGLSISYQSQTCTFTVDEDIPTVTQPLYVKNITKEIPCEYIYNLKNLSNITLVFSFEKFNLSQSNMVITGAAEEHEFTLKGQDLPADFLSGSGSEQVTIVVNIDPKYPSDQFVLRQRPVYEACSYYKEINGIETLTSPPLPSLIDGDLPTECHWHLKNSLPNQYLGLKFKTLDLKSAFDMIIVTDGSRLSLPPFFQVSYSTQNFALAQEIRTSTSEVIITYKPNTFASTFSVDVFAAGDGKYIRGNGTVKAMPNPRDENGTIFLLEVADGQNVVLNFKDSSFSSPTSLVISDDFSQQSRVIATLHGNVWYPIISPTSKMMIFAKNFKKGQFEAEFNGTASGCMHMSPGASDNFILSGNCDSSCAWIIPPIDSKNDLLLDLQYIALEKEDTIQVLRLNSNKTIVANITFETKHVPRFSFSADEGSYVRVTRGACPKNESNIILVARSSYLPACSGNVTLIPYETQQFTSPDYPNMYPLLSRCKLNITTSSAVEWLHLAFIDLDLAPNHCIQITQVSDKGTTSFQVTGSQMPNDLLYVGDAVVQFNSVSCNTTKDVGSYVTKQGFVINVTSTDCGGVKDTKTGKFVIANKTKCIWKISVPPTESDGSVNIIIYTTEEEEDKIGNYKLTVFDGSSVRNNEIKNSTTAEIWSTTNSLIFVYERQDVLKPSSQISISYQTKSCNASMQCSNKICLHPDWRCNGKNDCGDFSDERNCASVPTGEPPAPGISAVVFGICCVLFFFIGVAITVLTPRAIQRYRNRYHQFSDLSVIE